MKLLPACFLFAALTLPASAATPRQLYVAGKYIDAEAAALAEGGAAGYALAARSALAAETMRAEPCMPCLQHAEALALLAIEANPRLAEGHIEYVVALGYQARLMGVLEARLKGFAEKAKDHIDAAIAADPRNAWAWAALGGWNIEISGDAGSTLARWLYGASLRAGLDDFAKAFASAPDNLAVRYQYALALGAYNRDAYRSVIADALSRAASGAPQSAYESHVRDSARALLSALKAGDVQDFDRLVRHDQGYR